jgi:protein-tyrosine phosphatase
MKRILDVPGAVNLRDFGGYETTDGFRVKPALLFRSGMMTNITPEGRDAFKALGVRVICDLRRHDERESAPTPFPEDDPLNIHVPIDPGSDAAMRARTQRGGLEVDERIEFMKTINRELARDHTHHYRLVFESLIRADGGAFLIHCTAGKDRTGFGAAVILLALGVDRETVVDDYMLTNEATDFEGFILPRLRKRYGEHFTPDDAREVSGVREGYIRAALDELERSFGSFDRYLADGLGIDEDMRESLRARYLV